MTTLHDLVEQVQTLCRTPHSFPLGLFENTITQEVFVLFEHPPRFCVLAARGLLTYRKFSFMVLQATINLDIAGEIFYDFVEEIKLATEVKTLVLIDDLNYWDHPSEFRLPSNPFKKIHARNLSMVDAFSAFQTQGPANGVSVFALSTNATMNMSRAHMENATYTVKTEVYTDNELRNAVTHYKVSNLIKADIDSFLFARVKGLTGGVPKDTFFDAALI